MKKNETKKTIYKFVLKIMLCVALLALTACGNKSEKMNNEEKTEPISVETSTNDKEPTTSPTNEEIKDEVTSTPEATETPSTKEPVTKTPATETPKAPVTKEPATTKAPTTKPVETKEPTTKAPVQTSKPVETEAPKHTHDWKAVKATRTIEGYLEEVPVTREYIILEEYHDCEECGYIDIDEAIALWNEDAGFYEHVEKASHLFVYDENKVEPYLRKCIKKAGKANLSTHSITKCAGSWLFDENGNLIEDENGSPIYNVTTIEHKKYKDEITRVWREPRTEEYIDHYECSCGARK